MAEDLHDLAVPDDHGGLGNGESDRVMKELETEMEELDKLEEISTAPPTPKSNITHPAEDESHIDLASTPPASCGTRVWEAHRPSSQDFVIWEDTPEEQEAAEVAADDNYVDVPDEDKENNMTPTTSELEDEAEQEQAEHDAERQPLVDWAQAGLGPRDTFNLPLNHEMARSANHDPNILPNAPRPGSRRRCHLRTTEDDSDSDYAQQSAMPPEMVQPPLITDDRQRQPVAERTLLGALGTMQPRWTFRTEFRRMLELQNRQRLARQRLRLGSDDLDQ
ncbi:hypothetical protein N7510_003918 [Penicillium lagena]|uniref:uncharacterized protein n=1 Tax=Penicillium lagena TaxID=94218 RepID=UPI002541B0E4|nr:uncharacterized protein N7510_003918 [Penicillium lagena]KAJ5619934.1 hypothetical protein N7510_003918 [Penicillium lagena]